MQAASESVSSGMLSVFLAHNSDLKGAMALAKEYCETRHNINEPVCRIANYMFPECKVLAGHSEVYIISSRHTSARHRHLFNPCTFYIYLPFL